jgi:APA family basic amino acid/polyamine antiporter
VLAIYATVAVSALLAAGPAALARTPAPLLATVEAGSWAALAPAVRIGATVASLGVLLSLLAGVSRTAFAMAGNGDLPRFLACVHPRHRIPDRAQIVLGALVVAVVLVADVREAIGASSFAVLVYYAIANASALTLQPHERRWPRALAAFGVLGCVVIAASLPWSSVALGTLVLAAGAVGYASARARRTA